MVSCFPLPLYPLIPTEIAPGHKPTLKPPPEVSKLSANLLLVMFISLPFKFIFSLAKALEAIKSTLPRVAGCPVEPSED
jgi:hypothetical protein